MKISSMKKIGLCAGLFLSGCSAPLTAETTEDYSKLKAEITFDGTPTTVFYEDGKLTSFYDRMTSAVSIDEVISKFKEKNYIK